MDYGSSIFPMRQEFLQCPVASTVLLAQLLYSLKKAYYRHTCRKQELLCPEQAKSVVQGFLVQASYVGIPLGEYRV